MQGDLNRVFCSSNTHCRHMLFAPSGPGTANGLYKVQGQSGVFYEKILPNKRVGVPTILQTLAEPQGFYTAGSP